MITRIVLLVVALTSLVAADPASAKGATVELTITGPGLDTPTHSSEEKAIAANVWFGNYVDWESGPIVDASAEGEDYQVYFWVQLPGGQIEMMYMVHYRIDASTERAVVCIPGDRDPWYYLNTSTIVRRNEGSCFYAEEAWGNTIRSILQLG